MKYEPETDIIKLCPININATADIVSEFKVHLNQIGRFPESLEEIMSPKYASEQKELITKSIGELSQVSKNDIILFPELSIPRSLEDDLAKCSHENQIFIIGGSIYDEQYRNYGYIFTPSGQIYTQYKLVPASEEDKRVYDAHRNLEKQVNVFVAVSHNCI